MDFTSVIVFILVLFIYLHLTSQWKRSEDLEIYEMDYESNAQLQEVCDVKQPVLFEFKNVSPDFFAHMNIDNASTYDVCVKDTNDYLKETCVDSIIIPFKTAYPLLKSDPASHLISEGNEDFVEESSMTKYFQTGVDEYLKPSLTVRSKYDVCMGSDKSHTPLRYHMNSRHYCIVANGTIHVKMAPWKSGKYLNPVSDYENYEFFSHMDPWKYNEDKIKFLEFEVQEGYVLYVPPYWWYSIKYDSHDSIVCTATYNSSMNMVANAKHWMLYFFQQQNIQQKTMKTLDTHHTEGEAEEAGEEEGADAGESMDMDPSSIIKTLHHIGTDGNTDSTHEASVDNGPQ